MNLPFRPQTANRYWSQQNTILHSITELNLTLAIRAKIRFFSKIGNNKRQFFLVTLTLKCCFRFLNVQNEINVEWTYKTDIPSEKLQDIND